MRKTPAELQAWQNFFVSRPEVAAVYLFGSFGTEYEQPQSDIDLGVIFRRPVTLAEELELDAALSLQVGHERIDLINLNQASVVIQFQALRDGMLICERDYLEHSGFIERVLKAYPDYMLKYTTFAWDYGQALKEEYDAHGG